MDQVKLILANLKKYHFWILCVVVIITGITSWYMSTRSLDDAAQKSAANIKSKDSEINNVLQIKPHPNDDFIAGMDKLIDGYSNNLGQGWKFRYAQQKKLLVWPKRLGTDFRNQVNHLRPIEAHVTFDEKGYVASQEILSDYRELYRNFILLELPTLAERIGTKWMAKVGEASSQGSGMGKGPGIGKGAYGGGKRKSSSEGEEEEDKSIVFWRQANQQELLDEHFKFASELATPHTLDMLYAQEDLWVLEAIIDVIKRTNGDADANYNAAIKEIESIQMGRTVRGRLGKIKMLDGGAGMSSGLGSGGGQTPGAPGAPGAPSAPSAPGTSAAGGAAGGPPPGSGGPPPGSGGPPPGSGGAGGSTMPGGGMGTTAGSPDPAFERYVDIDYNPLSPKDLRAALTEENNPKLAIYSVAKRMPVRLRLRIDQRKLNDLLAECGNSTLPIEVRQVRINCDANPTGDSGMGGGGGFGGGGFGGGKGFGGGSGGGGPPPGSGGGGAGRSSGGGRGMMGGGSQNDDESKKDPNEVVVDVYGIVHIYNPLNQKQLNTNLREDDSEAPAAVEMPTATKVPETGVPRS